MSRRKSVWVDRRKALLASLLAPSLASSLHENIVILSANIPLGSEWSHVSEVVAGKRGSLKLSVGVTQNPIEFSALTSS